jgi:endonuclease/exonuclease/phosphatase family metal-dependent hydrolase
MRIVTYNTQGSLGMDNVRATGRIAHTLRPLSPDIICFQEIHRRMARSGREDQPEVLERLLHRRFCFQPNVIFAFGGGYGNGIATRFPVIEEKLHLLPSAKGKEQRGALEVRLRDVEGFRTLTIFSTHWGLDTEERKTQAEALAEIIRTAPKPIIVGGDFNESPDGEAIRMLLTMTSLRDADSGQDRATFVSNNPTRRIDLLLYSPELEISNVEVVPSLASDHLPLAADFRRNISP